VVTVTTGPPAPPVVPFRPSAGTAAKPIGCPGGTGPGDGVDGPGPGVDGLGPGVVGLGPETVSTSTLSNEPLALNVATPACPAANCVSVAVSAVPPLTVLRSEVPETVNETVYQVPMETVTGADASVVAEPPTSFFSSTVLLDRSAT